MKKVVFLACAALLSTVISASAQTFSVAKYKGDKQCAISLTFDDGVQEDYTLIAPHLNRFDLDGTFTINGGVIGDLDDHYSPRMTWDEVRSLAADGHEISNHSWSHPNLTTLSDEDLHKQIYKNDSIIVAEVGIHPTTFIYPYNSRDERVIKACRVGRVGTREYQFALGQRDDHQTKESIAAWLRQQIDEGLWGVTMTHGIYTAWDQWDEPWVLWDFFKEIAWKSDSIWCGTFAEVSAYTTERDSIKLDIKKLKGKRADKWKDCTSITPILNLDDKLFGETLTMKMTDAKIGQPIIAEQGGKTLNLYMRGNEILFDFNPYGGEILVKTLKADPLAGKTINVFGDSYVENHVHPYQETWHYKVAQKHGMKYNNYGKNGACIAFDRTKEGFGIPLYQKYTMMTDSADYVLVVSGHNDAYFISRDSTNIEPFKQHLEDLCVSLRQKYPNAKIGFVSPWNVYKNGFPIVTKAIEAACKRHGFHFLNASATSGIEMMNPEFRQKYCQFPTDNAHLNSDGHDLLVPLAEQFLMGM